MLYGRTRALPQRVDYALTLAVEIPPSDVSPTELLIHMHDEQSAAADSARTPYTHPTERMSLAGSLQARGSWLISSPSSSSCGATVADDDVPPMREHNLSRF
mmetsp:Transcript_20684/g.56779  ORF Transcript_20684/g.56779 Transcript_20684/m.56779 type:complete len:102 (-) Transcript_20684:316-621(-)